MRNVFIAGGIVLAAAQVLLGQTRTDLATQFGLPQSEIFLLPQNIKLTATYGREGKVCAFRIESREHSERAAPNLTDARFWTDSQHIKRLIADLVPENTRQGNVESRTIGLRVGEHMHVESDDSVEITRIQRSRPLLVTSEVPVADRLARIVFKRPECRDNAQYQQSRD
jgi:hypothetical protein